MALLVLYFAPERLRVPENFDAVSERLLVCSSFLSANIACMQHAFQASACWILACLTTAC